jgi:hypothetical protein
VLLQKKTVAKTVNGVTKAVAHVCTCTVDGLDALLLLAGLTDRRFQGKFASLLKSHFDSTWACKIAHNP